MENFISSFEQRSIAQKILIVVGISIVLLAFIALMFLATNPNQKKSTVTSTSSNPSTTSSDKTGSDLSNLVSPTPGDNNSEYTYVGNHFQITYDTSLYSATGNKDGGNDDIVLQSTGINKNLPPYSIYFLVESSNQLPLANLTNIFGSPNYSSENTFLDGNSDMEYQGSIQTGSLLNQSTVIIFTKNNFTYKIQLKYDSPTQESSIESSFNQLLGTFKAF